MVKKAAVKKAAKPTAKPSAKKVVKRRKPRPRAKKPEPREIGLLDAIQEAYSEIETLAQEMRDWADNMEENFSATQKYETVSGTADTLEELQEPDDLFGAPRLALNDIKITVQDPTPRRGGYSRAARNDQVMQLLEQVADALDQASADDTLGAAEDEAADLKSELDEAVSELQGCEFPGMYG
jgi:hypothetical protein